MGLYVDVHKRLDEFSLDVSFEVTEPSETLALLGASGSGKSLTLKCIAGVLKPDEGRIVLNDRVLFDSEQRVNVPAQKRHVGYLFQQYALFPNMTVEGNISAGAPGVARAERERRVAEQIRLFRLEGLEKRHPSELSGGQQQRVALARIFVGNPELILLDEPLSALDEHLRWQLELELSDVLKAFSGGAVYVTHNRDEVMRLCDTVCVVSDGASEDKLTVSELFSAPPTLAAALISGCKNVSKARVLGTSELYCEDWGVTLTTSMPVGPDVTYAGVRAHQLTASAVRGEKDVAAPTAASDAADVDAAALDAAAVDAAALDAAAGDTATSPAAAITSPAAGELGLNSFICDVARVVESTFSTIVMLTTPGGAQIRYECDKDVWAALGDPQWVVVSVDPDHVLPLSGGSRRHDGQGEAASGADA